MGRESSPFGLDEDFIEDPADPDKSIDKKMKKKMKLGNNPTVGKTGTKKKFCILDFTRFCCSSEFSGL